jgi:hypothetical protein
MQVQAQAYGLRYLEDAQCFEAKITLAPHTCWGAFTNDITDVDMMVGYAISLPVGEGFSLPLHSVPVGVLALHDATVLYIHDVACVPEVQGLGVAHELLSCLMDSIVTSSIGRIDLVAVQTAHGFWARHGFVAQETTSAEGYGDEAVQMQKRVHPIS